jgi:crotonobetainyl-CoA:carnitine CoA-transferase CaiB-like acyl-CoA transferase
VPDLALSDCRILDLTHHLCGPYCTKLFADYGADVIKIERPGAGDLARRLAPFKDDDPHPEKSGIFAYLNTNKRSVTLDLASPAGRQVFFDLLDTADMVVENFRPGVLDELGIGYKELAARKPAIVLVSISNFGQTGPYRDWAGSELVLFAMGGEMYSMGLAEREPIKMAGTAALFQSAAAAAVAAMGGLYGAKWGGHGEHFDISIFETQAGGVDRRHATIIGYEFTGRVSGRTGVGAALGFPNGVYPCADGFIEISGGGVRFPGTVRMLGSPPELTGPEWVRGSLVPTAEMKETFDAIFYPWLFAHTKTEIWEAAQREHVLCAPLYTMEDLFNDPVFRERGFFIEVERPYLGRFTLPGRPFIMSETPWTLRRPAPLLGQHTDEVLREIGYSDARINDLHTAGVVGR